MDVATLRDAAYISAREQGSSPDEASRAAALYRKGVRS